MSEENEELRKLRELRDVTKEFVDVWYKDPVKITTSALDTFASVVMDLLKEGEEERRESEEDGGDGCES